MRIAFGTDWHLDLLSIEEMKDFIKSVGKTDADAVVVSGDIATGEDIDEYLVHINNFLDKPFYFVHGNHDFYDSSFSDVREKTGLLVEYMPDIIWLETKSVQLTDNTAIFGCDGWYDGGGFGSYFTSRFELLDFKVIEELKNKTKEEIFSIINNFAKVGADHIRRELPELLKNNELVIFVTHVPPFKQLCKCMGVKTTSSVALPYFSSKIIGDTLVDVAKDYPNKEVLVLCGHTHEAAYYRYNNVNCICGAAKYKFPNIFSTIDIT